MEIGVSMIQHKFALFGLLAARLARARGVAGPARRREGGGSSLFLPAWQQHRVYYHCIAGQVPAGRGRRLQPCLPVGHALGLMVNAAGRQPVIFRFYRSIFIFFYIFHQSIFLSSSCTSFVVFLLYIDLVQLINLQPCMSYVCIVFVDGVHRWGRGR